MSGAWSVDAIQGLHTDKELGQVFRVRLVHFQEDPDRGIGTRNLLVTKDIVDRHGLRVGRTENHLSFGRAFRPDWRKLRDPNRAVWRLTNEGLGAMPRDKGVEEELGRAIRIPLEAAEEARGGDNGLRHGADERMIIHVLDVGQGDTILLQFPGDKFWMVDAYTWTNDRLDKVRDYLDQIKCSSIEKLIISHFHHDHIRRAPEIIQALQPIEVIVPNHVHQTSMVSRIIRAAGPRLRRLTMPIQFQLGSVATWLAPTAPIPVSRDPNEHALVLYCESTHGNALLPGDVPARMLLNLIRAQKWRFPHLHSFYKVTHHCSKTGNLPALLSAIDPCTAATSCAKSNRYGHPDPSAKALIDSLTGPGLHRFTFNPLPTTFSM